MASKAIAQKWLTETVEVETGFTYDADRNKIATTQTVKNVAITNLTTTILDGNSSKILQDNLLLISDARATINGEMFVPKVAMGVKWQGENYTIKSVTPFIIQGVLHHYEASLV